MPKAIARLEYDRIAKGLRRHVPFGNRNGEPNIEPPIMETVIAAGRHVSLLNVARAFTHPQYSRRYREIGLSKQTPAIIW